MSRGGVRKPAAKKKATGAVVTKRIQLRGRGSSRSEAAAGSNAGGSNRAEEHRLPGDSELDSPGPRMQDDQQHQQPAPQQGGRAQLQPASRKRKSSAAAGSSSRGPKETILSLTAEALQEIFKHLGEQQSFCRWVLGKNGMHGHLGSLVSSGYGVSHSATRSLPTQRAPLSILSLQGGASSSMQALSRRAAAAQLGLGGKYLCAAAQPWPPLFLTSRPPPDLSLSIHAPTS